MADLVPAAGSITWLSGPRETRTAGEAFAAGASVFIDTSNSNKMMKSDSNASGKKDSRGIALDPSTGDGDSVQVALSGSRINLGVTLGVGTIYMASETPGGIQPSADFGSGEDLILLGAGETAAIFAVHIWVPGITK